MGKIYFASDFHLGAPDANASRLREKEVVRWLNTITPDCDALYLLGDVFDFWFEYQHTAPKGFVRLLGTLANMADSGIPIFFFPGNHDLWVKNYLDKEIGWTTFRAPQYVTLQGKTCLIGHGDGLGPGDHGFKLLKKLFTAPWAQWLFSRIHPNLAFTLATKWSKHSRLHHPDEGPFQPDKEFLVGYGYEQLKIKSFDYLIMGHRHLPIWHELQSGSIYCNLGDWIQYFTFGEMEHGILSLKKWKE